MHAVYKPSATLAHGPPTCADGGPPCPHSVLTFSWHALSCCRPSHHDSMPIALPAARSARWPKARCGACWERSIQRKGPPPPRRWRPCPSRRVDCNPPIGGTSGSSICHMARLILGDRHGLIVVPPPSTCRHAEAWLVSLSEPVPLLTNLPYRRTAGRRATSAAIPASSRTTRPPRRWHASMQRCAECLRFARRVTLVHSAVAGYCSFLL